MATECRLVQRRIAIVVLCENVGASLQQRLARCNMTSGCRQVQWRVPIVCASCSYVRAGRDQSYDNCRAVAVLRSNMKGCETALIYICLHNANKGELRNLLTCYAFDLRMRKHKPAGNAHPTDVAACGDQLLYLRVTTSLRSLVQLDRRRWWAWWQYAASYSSSAADSSSQLVL